MVVGAASPSGLLLVALAPLIGCEGVPTSAIVELDRTAETPLPAAIDVVVAGPRGMLARERFPQRGRRLALPGTIFVGLPDGIGDVTVTAVGLAADLRTEIARGAAGPVDVPAGTQVRMRVVLSRPGGGDASDDSPRDGGSEPADDAGTDGPALGDAAPADEPTDASPDTGPEAGGDTAIDPAIDPVVDPAIDPVVDAVPDLVVDAAVDPAAEPTADGPACSTFFADGFDSGTLSAWNKTHGAMPTVVATSPLEGTHSLRVSQTAANGVGRTFAASRVKLRAEVKIALANVYSIGNGPRAFSLLDAAGAALVDIHLGYDTNPTLRAVVHDTGATVRQSAVFTIPERATIALEWSAQTGGVAGSLKVWNGTSLLWTSPALSNAGDAVAEVALGNLGGGNAGDTGNAKLDSVIVNDCL